MHCTSKLFNIDVICHRENIEKKESEVRLKTATERSIFPPTNVTTRSGYDEGLDQDTNFTLSNSSKDSKPLRITRSSNVEALKRKDAVEIGDADNRSPSPKRFVHPYRSSLISLLTTLGHNLLYQKKRCTYRM